MTKRNDTEVVAALYDTAVHGLDKDDAAHEIFKRHGGKHYYQECCYALEGPQPSPDREIGYFVNPTRVKKLREELGQAGFIVRIGEGVGAA